MNMVIVWGIVAVAALLLEIATVGAMTSIWFAVGALIALLLALLKLGTTIQLIVFIVVSVASYFKPTVFDRVDFIQEYIESFIAE